MPVALHLEQLYKKRTALTESAVSNAIALYPLLRRHHVSGIYLPNLVRKIIRTCFSLSQRPGNRSNDPVGHILNKAWPMRCSVRNFSDIVSLYIVKHPLIYTLMRQILYSSMVGAYDSGSVHATARTRILLYKYYVVKPLSAHQFAHWLRQGHYLLLFIAIKEYISFSVSQLPGLFDVLQQSFSWVAFSESVTRHADMIRSTLNQYAATPGIMFDKALQIVSNIRSYKCPAPPLDIAHISDQLQTSIRMLYHPSCDVYTMPLRMKLYRIINRAVAADVPVCKLLMLFGVREEIAKQLQICVQPLATLVAWRRLRSIKISSEAEAVFLHEFMQAWVSCKQIRCYDLPSHVAAQQATCLTSRHTIYACICCRQLRAFVVDEKNTCNAWACGHHRVLLDDMTGVVYCGKRSDAHASATHRAAVDSSCRSYWKNQQNLMCSYCPLLEINLAGKILAFFGKLYILCPRCACVMRLNDSRFYGDSIMCVNCSYRSRATPDSRCFHCYTQCTAMTKIALSTTTVYVCKGCTRRWMRNDSITQNLTEDIAHQAINERWSMNRVAVYCVCT